MERGSDKHGRLIDEEMKKDAQPLEKGEPTESRVEDFRKDEEIEPDPDELDQAERPEP